jgi:hypothetical protein
MGIDEFIIRYTYAYMENKEGMNKNKTADQDPSQKVNFTIKIDYYRNVKPYHGHIKVNDYPKIQFWFIFFGNNDF